MNSSSKPVIIIGAGVGGLSTATLLVNDGYSVSVYEKSDRVGAVSYTHLTLPTIYSV